MIIIFFFDYLGTKSSLRCADFLNLVHSNDAFKFLRSDFPKFINKSAKDDEKSASNQLKLQADKEAKKLKEEISKNSKSSIYAFFNKN